MAVLVLAAGCGSDEQPAGPVPITTTISVSPDKPPIPLPTATDLNAAVLIGLNPGVPADRKAGWIQGVTADSALVREVMDMAQRDGVTVKVVEVRYVGDGQMEAEAEFSVLGQRVDGLTKIPFVVEDGRWKLQKQWACQLLTTAGISSNAC